jgi:hypothetical protein
LLIDEEVIVDVLVAYGFHTESRMLVMAETGYPDYLLAHAVRLMRDQPELPVYLLHAVGNNMHKRLASGSTPWPAMGNYVDLGWNENMVRKLPALRGIPDKSPDDRRFCAAADAKWRARGRGGGPPDLCPDV